MPTFTPYVEEKEKNKFTPYIEPPKFTAFKPEKPVFTPLKKEVSEQVFTPYFEPYDMSPPQIRDMAKIMGSVAEAPKEPAMGLEYIPAKVYSYLVEEPLANAGALVSQGLEKGFRLLGMNDIADTQVQVTETYKSLPITESVKEQTAYLRQQAYKRGQGQGIMFDISEAGTRFGSLLVQMGTLRKIPILKTGEIGKRFATLGIHGFLTTEGDLRDRLDATVYRIGYASTPFLAQHWGATGLKSIAIDAVLNTMMTTPAFLSSYKQAKETGDWKSFTSNVITQMVMNVGMALTTTGYPEAQRAAKMKSYLKGVGKNIDMSYKDLNSIVKSFDKAQNPKTPIQKQALAKQEAKLQKLMQKDNANIELEKLAADEKNSPINKLIKQAEDNPATPNIQNKINNMAAELSTNQQKAWVHIRAKELGLLTKGDKEKQVYQAYMESLVGEKSTKNMNQGQIKMVIDNLDKMLPATAKRLAKTKVKGITPELVNVIQGISEIGFKEKFRNPYEVFNKMGLLRQTYLPSEAAEVALYDDKMKFRQELKKMLHQDGITKDSRKKVFDAIENPKDVIDLNPSEVKLRDFSVKFFDDWANKLKLPPEKRRDKYVTHIFEKALTEMTDKGFVDPDILRAFEFGAIPKDIKNPFIHNERTGQEYGLKRDVVEAMNVYESYALRTFHYEPLLGKMDIYSKFLPELSRKYLGNFVGRLTNRPLDIDKGMNNDIRALTDAVAKSPAAKAPIFKKLLPLLKEQTQGNFVGTAAYYYTGLIYEAALGMRPDAAIRNLGQGVLTICESGIGNYAKGVNFLLTKEGKEALHKSVVYRSRKYAYLPSQGGYVPQNVVGNVKNAMMYMFKSADKFNVSTAFATGYQEAKSLGLPDPICIERGDEVARSTQYMYTKMAAPETSMTALGKTLSIFTSWPRNYFELTRHWLRGDVSEVYKNYEKMTGKKVYKEDWVSRHRAAMMYAALYAIAMYVEEKTDIKATQYTGIRSLEAVPRLLSGQAAGLRLPIAITKIGAGVIGQNKQMLKEGIKQINPITWFNALNKLDDIKSGKKDWLDMFFYRNKKRKFRLR